MSMSFARNTLAPVSTLVRRLPRPSLSTLMPYLYVVVLVITILLIEPVLIDGPGAIDVNISATLPLAIVAFGQTLAMFTRGIDLSIGGIISLTTAILATSGNVSGATLILEVVGLALLGLVLGTINGIVIARTRLQPFIVTLAMWSIWDGVALAILPTEGGTVPSTLTNATLGSIAGIPKSIWGLAILFALWGWMRDSRFVRDLRAIGSDEERARLLGVPIGRRKVQTYALTGALAAIAGIYLAAQQASGSPTAGDEFILTSVAAVIIGGTSLFGGRGSAAGSIVGAVAYLMIPNVITALNINSFWSVFLQGFLLIVAVTVSSLATRIAARRRA
jgi:ribose transport system permease protein